LYGVIVSIFSLYVESEELAGAVGVFSKGTYGTLTVTDSEYINERVVKVLRYVRYCHLTFSIALITAES
jgi:hypothetical protein